MNNNCFLVLTFSLMRSFLVVGHRRTSWNGSPQVASATSTLRLSSSTGSGRLSGKLRTTRSPELLENKYLSLYFPGLEYFYTEIYLGFLLQEIHLKFEISKLCFCFHISMKISTDYNATQISFIHIFIFFPMKIWTFKWWIRISRKNME